MTSQELGTSEERQSEPWPGKHSSPHLFGESGEKISSSKKVKDQVQLPFSLECYKYTQVSIKCDSPVYQETAEENFWNLKQ